MTDIATDETDVNQARVAPETEAPAVIAVDVLVEDVSIDGMCGVY